MSLLSYAPVLLLACVFVARRGAGPGWRLAPILLYVAFLTAVHLVTIASVRYRLPLEPFLIVLGMAALADLLARRPRAAALLDTVFGARDAPDGALRPPAAQTLA